MIVAFILGDFGIAKMMENTFDMAQTCCGTPCYLSPELCQDMPYSSKADVWVKTHVDLRIMQFQGFDWLSGHDISAIIPWPRNSDH